MTDDLSDKVFLATKGDKGGNPTLMMLDGSAKCGNVSVTMVEARGNNVNLIAGSDNAPIRTVMTFPDPELAQKIADAANGFSSHKTDQADQTNIKAAFGAALTKCDKGRG